MCFKRALYPLTMLCILYVSITPLRASYQVWYRLIYAYTYNCSPVRFSLLAQLMLLSLFRKACTVGRNRLNPCHVAEPWLNLPDRSQLKLKAGSSRSGWKRVCGHNVNNLFVDAWTRSFSRWEKKIELPVRSVLRSENV